jgi:hypothetical protein
MYLTYANNIDMLNCGELECKFDQFLTNKFCVKFNLFNTKLNIKFKHF